MGLSHLVEADHAGERAHRPLDPVAQPLEVLRPAVRVQRLLRRPLLDEDEFDVILALQRTQQVVADAPGLAAGGLDHLPQHALHLILLAYLGIEGGDHVNGALRHAVLPGGESASGAGVYPLSGPAPAAACGREAPAGTASPSRPP